MTTEQPNKNAVAEAEEERLREYAERTHNPPHEPVTEVGPKSDDNDKDEDE